MGESSKGLRALRSVLRLDIRTVADETGLSKTTIVNAEDDDKSSSEKTVRALLNFYRERGCHFLIDEEGSLWIKL